MFKSIAAVLMLTVSFYTAEGSVLTLEESVSAACSNRAEVSQAELSIRSAEAAHLGSTLWFTPTVSADAGLSAMETEMPESEMYSSSININASMNLFNLQSIGRRRTASVAVSIAEEASRATRAVVIFDTASSWYSVLQAQAALELADLNLSTQEEMFRLVGEKYNLGMVSRYEYLSGHVSLENTRPVQIAASASLENALGSLSVAIGQSYNEIESVEGSLDEELQVTIPESPEDLAEIAIAKSSEVILARLSLESASTQTFTAHAGYAPSLRLNGTMGWSNGDEDLFELGSNDMSRTSSVGVSLHVPIFSSFGTETAVKTARLSELSAQYELSSVENDTRQSALEAWNNILSSQQRLVGANSLVLEAQEALEIAQITYEAGSITRLDLEQSILGFVTAREHRSEAQLAMRMAELNIAMLTGEIHELWEVEE